MSEEEGKKSDDNQEVHAGLILRSDDLRINLNTKLGPHAPAARRDQPREWSPAARRPRVDSLRCAARGQGRRDR